MSSTQTNSKRPSWSRLIVVLIWPIMSLQGCEKLSRTSNAHGRVTAIGGSGLDSVAVVFVAVKLSGGTALLRVFTDKNGNYSGTVDVPKGYGTLDVVVPTSGNPKYTDVYRDYDIYVNGRKTNDCCPAEIGGKTQYDFKMYK
jgi:hypothetical protein